MAPRPIPVAAVVLFLSSVFGQPTRTTATVYFLRDDSHGRWCGYRSESQLRDEARPLGGVRLSGRLITSTDAFLPCVSVRQMKPATGWLTTSTLLGGMGSSRDLRGRSTYSRRIIARNRCSCYRMERRQRRAIPTESYARANQLGTRWIGSRLHPLSAVFEHFRFFL